MLAILQLICFFLAAPCARAVDSIALELGASNATHASVDQGRVGVQWNWAALWALGTNWHIGGYWDLSLGYWSNHSPERTNRSVIDLGFTPVLRLQQTNPGALAPYLDGAIGLHLLSETSVAAQRRFGSHVQFGSHLGFGMRLGARHEFDLGYRYQHLSNAGASEPNQGMNFHQLRFQYHY